MQELTDAIGDTIYCSVGAGGDVALQLLAQTRPQIVAEAVEKEAVAISRRQGEWGVDGAWSYNFSKFGYAGATISYSTAKDRAGIHSDFGTHGVHPDAGNSSNVKRCDVLEDSFKRVFRSRGRATTFRVLDLGSGGGGWLLQARKELTKKNFRGSLTVHLHGVTGDALPSEVGSMTLPKTKQTEPVKVAHFQQIGIETFPLRLGSDTYGASTEQREDFKQMVEDVIMAGGDGRAKKTEKTRQGYDLILSSWTFCHLIDPLATLELWSNALAVEGELYVNDIDFSVLFDDEGTHADHALWESDPEKRMERAFVAVSRKGEADHAFSIEFEYDDKDYRTAIKLRRLSAVPIRFAPVVGYSSLDEEDGESALADSLGRPVYRISDNMSKKI
jgi:SAM-dependent methyltransferase